MNVQKVSELYIDFRNSLKYRDSTSKTSHTKHTIRTFAKFLGESKRFDQINQDDCASFLYRRTEVTNAWRKEFNVLKKMFEWAVVRGYIQAKPLPEYLPKFPDSHPPYIYSNEELKRLFEVSLTYSKGHSPVTDVRSIRFILMLTYVLGLRCRETLNIRLKHIDTKQKVIHIEDSKFFKSRYVTYNAKVANLINEIIEWRKSGQFSTEPEDLLFVTKLGKPVHFVTLHCIFAQIRKKANLYFPELKRHQPRIHDLRHTFATNVLTGWYKEGKNVQELLPKLSVYLGHENLSHTAVYLSMIPALLEEANKLFYKYKNQNYKDESNN